MRCVLCHIERVGERCEKCGLTRTESARKWTLKRNPTAVPASEISDFGGCFRKPGGTSVYMRMSESAVRFLGLNQEVVYGISVNGNVAVLYQENLVVPMFHEDLLKDVEQTRSWERSIGCQDRILRFRRDELRSALLASGPPLFRPAREGGFPNRPHLR